MVRRPEYSEGDVVNLQERLSDFALYLSSVLLLFFLYRMSGFEDFIAIMLILVLIAIHNIDTVSVGGDS